ncbi:hypothetical protein TNCT6_63990 [Streptomyces sp. 6-11-2]|nr:hypothetical protein TNCT6_63990 [Streptomyces sp. 6-11-2]
MHTSGGIVKYVWLALAILLACLTLGAVSSLVRRGDPFDLLMAFILGAGTVASGRRASVQRDPRLDDSQPDRPWHR